MMVIDGYKWMSETSQVLQKLWGEAFQKWQYAISALWGEPFDNFSFAHSINNLHLAITSYAKAIGKEYCVDFSINQISQFQAKSPVTLPPYIEERLGSIIVGFSESMLGKNLEKEQHNQVFCRAKITNKVGQITDTEDIRGIHSHQFSILRAIKESFKNKEEKAYNPNYESSCKVLDLCLAKREEYTYFKHINCEDKFIDLVLELMKKLCDYVERYPAPTLRHNSHLKVKKLLCMLDSLLFEREKPVIDRSIMLLEKTIELNTTNKGIINDILDTIKYAIFKDDSNRFNDFSFLQSFKFSSEYSHFRDEYYKYHEKCQQLAKTIVYDPVKSGVRSTKTSAEIKEAINQIPADIAKIHLHEKNLSPSFDKIFLNTFTRTNKHQYMSNLNYCGFNLHAKQNSEKLPEHTSLFRCH